MQQIGEKVRFLALHTKEIRANYDVKQKYENTGIANGGLQININTNLNRLTHNNNLDASSIILCQN